MPEIISKSDQVPSPRGLYTPGPVQDRVIARHFAGESNDEIAAAENLDPGTVRRILAQPKVARPIEESRAQTQSLLRSAQPKAARVLIEFWDFADPRYRYLACVKLLELLVKGSLELPKPELDPDRRLANAIAQVTSMALAKHFKYGTAIPKDMERIVAEVRREMEEDSPDIEPTS